MQLSVAILILKTSVSSVLALEKTVDFVSGTLFCLYINNV